MGKATEQRIQSRSSGNNTNTNSLLLQPCDNLDAPICDDCCSPQHHQHQPIDSTTVLNSNCEKTAYKEEDHKVIRHSKEQEQVAAGRLQSIEPPLTKDQEREHDDDDEIEEEIKELVVIGAGPHAMALILRLLCPEPDLMTEKERHYKMDHHDKKLRRIPDVKKYIRNLTRSINKPGQILLQTKAKKQQQLYTNEYPPPIELDRLRNSVVILDKSNKPTTTSNDKEDAKVEDANTTSGWLVNWKTNFAALQIPSLRSPTTAHLDPYDHRALDAYADVTHQATATHLVPFPYLTQRDKEFHGPYEAPTTPFFHEFHNVLSKAYGIHDLVSTSSEVTTIIPKQNPNNASAEPYFEVHVRKTNNASITKEMNTNNEDEKKDGDHTNSITTKQSVLSIVKTKRVVCALGPMFRTGTEFWEQNLPHHCRHRILHCHDIVPWLVSADCVLKSRKKHPSIPLSKQLSVLIVGGGITSTHLTLLASKAAWCKHVTIIQRSKIKERQFDIDNKWMGPYRGKYLEQFWSLSNPSKVQCLKSAREGGTVPPELVRKLQQKVNNSRGTVQHKEDVQIADVVWTAENNKFRVQLDDGLDEVDYDMIWLATGADNDIALYECLQNLMKELPIDVAGGLPVLDTNLCWKAKDAPSTQSSTNTEEKVVAVDDKTPIVNEEEVDDKDNDEPTWKKILRQRLHVMGCLAGLQLGPDALNLIGARHGSVRVAKAIRLDMMCDENKDQ